MIHGKRNATPSLPQFSFEAQKGGIWTTAVLSSENIDLAPDGSFTVTADSEKAEGKRNHLYLPPETSNLLIRDTLADWSSQLPNDLQIERIDDTPSTPRDRAEIVKQATKFIAKLDEAYVQFLELPWKLPVNQLKPALRPLAYGLPGSGAAIGRFSIKSNEALVVTLDTVGAKYLGFVLGDPWQRSLNYWDHFASLNNFQAKANDDGTITYVISIKDPGVNNWLDTEGLHNGIITLRWGGIPAGCRYLQRLPRSAGSQALRLGFGPAGRHRHCDACRARSTIGGSQSGICLARCRIALKKVVGFDKSTTVSCYATMR